jgi:putative tricarboxylic transport membrane protein
MASTTSGKPGLQLRLGADRIIALLCLGFVLLYGWGGSNLATALQGDVIGPALFPAVLAAFGVLLCVVLFVNGRPPAAKVEPETGPDAARDTPAPPDPDLPALVPVALLLAYVLVLERVGFLLSTAVFLTVAFRYLGHPRWGSALAYAVVFTLVIYLLFHVGLGIKLPAGLLGTRVPFS